MSHLIDDDDDDYYLNDSTKNLHGMRVIQISLLTKSVDATRLLL